MLLSLDPFVKEGIKMIYLYMVGNYSFYSYKDYCYYRALFLGIRGNSLCFSMSYAKNILWIIYETIVEFYGW